MSMKGSHRKAGLHKPHTKGLKHASNKASKHASHKKR